MNEQNIEGKLDKLSEYEKGFIAGGDLTGRLAEEEIKQTRQQERERIIKIIKEDRENIYNFDNILCTKILEI